MASTHSLEPARVYAELVAALFTAVLPFAIMAVTFAGVGGFIVLATGDGVAASALLVGLLATFEKARVHHDFRRSPDTVVLSPPIAAHWERRFAIGNLAFAAALGTLAARTFSLEQPSAQLLATGMLFGFCAGQVARIAVRDRLCSVTICVAAGPCVLAAAAHGGVANLSLAAMFVVFAVGSIESVRFSHAQIRERIIANQELSSMASLDPLTGLFNRLGLRRGITELFDGGSAMGLLAVHSLDLDGFKGINDRFGHPTGDRLLIEIANRLKACMRDTDVAARFGGDEFVLLQTGLSHPDEAEIFARRVCRAVTAPYIHDDRQLIVGVSVGSCTGAATHDAFDALLAVADGRMYAAKRSGGGVQSSTIAVSTLPTNGQRPKLV